MPNKEEIYDSQIAPLMTTIIEVCKANKIAMLASFHIPTEDDDGLVCTTATLEDDFEPPKQFLDALSHITGSSPSRAPLMVTTRGADGKIIRMDAIL